MTALFPDKLAFLFRPARYKVAFGGRGGLKSWGFADALLIQGAGRPLRILCARENMNSIAESVHHLLETRIQALGLANRYSVEKARIIGTNGTEFIFAGLRHNVANIKSLEAVDIVWVEEAATVSKGSWETLIPTVRKDESEIWVSFNPELETDDTFKRFVLNPAPGAVVIKTDYRDNPWFPDVLRAEMEHLRDTDYAAYEHVWLGECRKGVVGAIFGEQLKAADLEGRLCSVPVDRTKPVHTFWDLGFGDLNAIWFAQAVNGWYHFIDYLEGNGRTIADWLIELQQRRYVYGTHWLPHDGVDALLHKRLTGDRTKSPEMLLREAGFTVRVAPKYEVMTRINMARTIFSQCRFDADRCADGIQGLRHYQWAPSGTVKTEAGVTAVVPKREPLHDWASHPADAFCTAGVSLKQTAAPPTFRPPAPPRHLSAWS